MVKLGNIPSDYDSPYLETGVGYTLANNIAPSTSLDLTLASFTMPWVGGLIVDVVVSASWDNRQQLSTNQGAGAMPAVSGFLGYSIIAQSPITFAQCPAEYWWASLTRGQVVSPSLRITAGAGVDSVTLDTMQINYRAWMT